MSQQHSNTKKRSFQHLTPYQRGQIQALIEQRIPKVHIAKQVGIARSTLYEELKRGTVDQMRSDLTYYKRYFADTGQLVYMRRREASRKPFKLSTAAPFLKYLEKEVLQNKFSPDSICGRAKLQSMFPIILCTKTIYNYIDLGLISIKNIDLPLRKGGDQRNTIAVRTGVSWETVLSNAHKSLIIGRSSAIGKSIPLWENVKQGKSFFP